MEQIPEEKNPLMKRRRLELGLSADEVAEQIGVSRATMYRYESGDVSRIPSYLVERLASVLQISPARLLGTEDEVRIFDDFLYAVHRETRTMTDEEKDVYKRQIQQRRIGLLSNGLIFMLLTRQ